MEYKQLGNSTLRISRIGFGGMSLVKGHKANEMLLRKAFDHGINYFDTADLYHHGENEEELGRALKTIRKEVHLATKVGNVWKKDRGEWEWNASKKYILKAADLSLKRLQTDYIDLYQLHGGTLDDPFDETLEAFELLKQQGKIRYYGISSIRPNVIRRWLDHSKLTSNMMQYSLLDRRPEEECLDWLKQRSVGVVVRGGLAKGLLVNKPSRAYLNYSPEEVKRLQEMVNEVSKERSMAQTALLFTLAHGGVTSAVVGIRTEEQLIDAVGTFDSKPLTFEEYEMLKWIIKPNKYEQHRLL
ncbi:aldo/keto reductase [Fulvivirga sp. M361]|nr:aldo/keto reductase [Fulvivirga sp. M361]